jgi:hypothetical protein
MATARLTWERVRSPVAALRALVSPSAVAVCGVLLLQVVLFSPSWRAFFCGDSVFYLSRILEPAQLGYLFTHCDIQGAYRPLTYVLFSWVFYPRFGLDPFGYHLAALGMHLLGCLLVYGLFRLVLRPAAALAGLFFFSIHAVNFYTTYDLTFLPDLMALPCWIGALLCYSRFIRAGDKWAYAAAFGLFVAGLLSKEIVIMLPCSLVVWGWLLRRSQVPTSKSQVPGPRSQVLTPGGLRLGTWDLEPVFPALPFFAASGLFLLWTAHIKYGLLFPGGVYGFTLRPGDLFQKLNYLAWLNNLPTGWHRASRPALLAAALAFPFLVCGWWLLARAWGKKKWELAACGLWAASALAPLLVVTQVPMKHNLYVPLAACGLALGIAVEAGGARRTLRRFWWAAAALAISIAIQARLDLRYSWVGEGSQITQASLEALRRARPALPRGALLYVLPSQVRGNAAWYFDSGGLFRVFYHDPTLRMAFADDGQKLPADFASRNDVVILQFTAGRLYDVTAEYAAEWSEPASYHLLDTYRPEAVQSKYQWRPADLPPGGPAYKGLIARGDVSREALVMLPGTTVRLPVPAIPPGSVLSIGVTPAGACNSGTQGRIELEHDGQRELLALRTLDSADQKDEWWDSEANLSRWEGRAGVLVISSVEDPGADWLAWSRLRIEPAQRARARLQLDGVSRRPSPHHRLLDQFRPDRVAMDRREPYLDYTHFQTPSGTPAFFQFVRPGEVGRLALVTLAGARVWFPVRNLNANSVLLVSLAPALRLGDGMEARIYFEAAGRRQLLFSQNIRPDQRDWRDVSVALGTLAGRQGDLVLECGSGSAGDNTGDWLAWGRLRIETQPPQQRWAGSGNRNHPENLPLPPSSSSRTPPITEE